MDLHDLVLVLKELADFDDLGFTDVSVPVERGHEEHGQRKHDPQLLSARLGVIVGDSVHQSLHRIGHAIA